MDERKIEDLHRALVECRLKAALYRERARKYELELACVEGQERTALQQRMDDQLGEISEQEGAICSLSAELRGQLSGCLPAFVLSEGFSTLTFATAKDLTDYNTERIRNAQSTIDAVTWGTDNPDFTPTEAVSADDFNLAIDDSCRRGVRFRQVMAFNHKYYLNRAKNHLASNPCNYDLRYYDFDAYSVPPQMHFIIFDSREITFAFYRWPVLMPKKEVRVATTNPDIVRLFRDYYEAIWEGARPIDRAKEGEADCFKVIGERLASARG